MQDSSGLIYGDACECDSLSCPKDPENEEICGGLGRLLQTPATAIVNVSLLN